MAYQIVETDNFGSDYPDEKFVNIPPIYERNHAKAVADAINECYGKEHSSRFYKVVETGYQLQPGFEP